jgi:hypothetical protein
MLGRSVLVARDPPSEPSPGHRAGAVRLLRRRRKVDRREMNDIHELNPRALRLPGAQAALVHGLFAAVRRLPAGHRSPWQPRADAGRRSHHPLSPSARLRSWPSRMRSCSLTDCTSTRSSRPRAGCGGLRQRRHPPLHARPALAGRPILGWSCCTGRATAPTATRSSGSGPRSRHGWRLPDIDDPGSHPPGPRLLPRLHASCDRPGSSLLDPVMCESTRFRSGALSGRACLARSTMRSMFCLALAGLP